MDQELQSDQKIKPEDKKPDLAAEDPPSASTIDQQCQHKVNILLKHGKYDLKDVVITKKKVLNLRIFIEKMKQDMKKQSDEVMTVDEEIKNGRPAGSGQRPMNMKTIIENR